MTDTILFINCIVLLHLIVFSVLLFTSNRSTYNIKILSLVLITQEISMILGAVKFSSYEYLFSKFIYLEVIFYINAIVVYYFYLTFYLDNRVTIKKKLIHLLFPILYILTNTIALQFFPIDYQRILHFRNEINIYFEWDILFAFIYTFIYSIVCLKLISKKKKELKKVNQYKKEYFFWIDFYTWFITIIVFSSIISELFSSILGYCVYVYVIVYLFFIVSIAVIVVKNLPDFIFNNKISQKRNPNNQKEKYLIYINLITKAIQEKNIHLNKDLNLNIFAGSINIPPHVVSEIIRSKYQKNFNQFINEYRIKKATALLTESENSNYTIDAIGEMAGFKSRSTFYSSFKREIGMSPIEYRKKVTAQVKSNQSTYMPQV